MADVNVLGLNIELQLRSQKFEDALKEFVDNQVSKISDDLSQMMTKAIDAIDLGKQLEQVGQLKKLLLSGVSSADLSTPIAQTGELRAGMESVSEACDLTKSIEQSEELTDKLNSASKSFDMSAANEQIDEAAIGWNSAEAVYSTYAEAVMSGGVAQEFKKSIFGFAKETKGIDNVTKAIKRKNLGHKLQNEELDISNKSIGTMEGGMGGVESGVNKANLAFGLSSKALGKIYLGILASSKAAEKFVTANFRAYGHQEDIVRNTQILAGEYGVLGDEALAATKALMEEGMRPESIADTTMVISRLSRVTGIAAESLAEMARQNELLGLNINQSAAVMQTVTDAMRDYGLNTKEAGELTRKLSVPIGFADRAFAKTAKGMMAFAETKAQIAGFAKKVGADIGSVVSKLNELAEGNVESRIQLMALSGMGSVSAENLDVAWQRAGANIKQRLAGLEKGSLEYAIVMKSIRESYGLNQAQVESMMGADEAYRKEVEEFRKGTDLTIEQAEVQINQKKAMRAANRELMKSDPSTAITRGFKDWAAATDNLARSYELFGDIAEQIGNFIYSNFYPAFKLIFDILIYVGYAVVKVIDFMRYLWRSFWDLTGATAETRQMMKTILGLFIIGGAILMVYGSKILNLGGLFGYLGRGLVWLKDRFLGLFGIQNQTTNNVTKNTKSMSERIKEFFMNLKDVATTMIKVAIAMVIMAAAVAILAYSIVMLAQLDYGKLWSALGAVLLLMGALILAVFLLSKIAANSPGKLILMAITMVILAVSIVILAYALKMLADIPFGKLMAGVLAIFLVMVILVGAVALLSLLGPIGIGIMLVLAVVFLAMGVALWLAGEGISMVVAAFGNFLAQADSIWSAAGALVVLAVGMFLVTLMVIPFTLALIVLTIALLAFGGAMWFVRKSIEIVGNAILNLGNGMALIVANATKLKDLSKETINAAKGIGEGLMTIADAVNKYDIGKSMAMALVLTAFAGLEASASVLKDIGQGFTDIANATGSTEQVNAFSTELNNSLTNIAENQDGVAALQTIANAFMTISASVADLSNVNEILIQLKNGVTLFDEIGNAPDNIERIGNALYNMPDLSNLAEASAGLQGLSDGLTGLLEIGAVQEDLIIAIDAISIIADSLFYSAIALIETLPYIAFANQMLTFLAPSLFLNGMVMEMAGLSFMMAGSMLADGAYYLADAVYLITEIDIFGFLDSLALLSFGLGMVSMKLFFNALAFKMAMISLAFSVPILSVTADEVDRLANALGLLAENIANLNSLGSIDINAESMIAAAQQATQAVESYQDTVLASQEQQKVSEKKVDTQPINQVQVKTGGNNLREDESLEPDILRQLEIIADLLREARNGGTQATSATTQTVSSSSNSESFNLGGWF